MATPAQRGYQTTEYKGGADEMYITYDLWQETRGNNRVDLPTKSQDALQNVR